MTEHRAAWLTYFRRQRLEQIRRYRLAAFVSERQSARRAALHYSNLIRRMAR
jgi:hypothetical protein